MKSPFLLLLGPGSNNLSKDVKAFSEFFANLDEKYNLLEFFQKISNIFHENLMGIWKFSLFLEDVLLEIAFANKSISLQHYSPFGGHLIFSPKIS